MTREEYDNKLGVIELDYRNKKNALIKEYGLSQAKFKVGDIVRDHRFIMKIDKIKAALQFGEVLVVYEGFELTKKLEIRKDKSRRGIYGNEGVELMTNDDKKK